MIKPSLGRRGALAALAATVPALARAQLPPPQVVPIPPPTPQVATPTATPASPHPPSSPAPPIDRTKAYYVFFDQTIDVNSMRALRRQLAALVEAGVERITLVISSPGGAVDPMLVTYSFIRALPATVDTHAQGFVASAATVLFLAGNQRSADRAARFLFHPGTTAMVGVMNEQQVQDRLSQVDAVQGVMASIYQDRTRLTNEQVQHFASAQVVLTAEQARDAGVVDQVADLKIPGGNTAKILLVD